MSPIFVAVMASLLAMIFQTAGSYLVFTLIRPLIRSKILNLAVSWLLFVPIVGAFNLLVSALTKNISYVMMLATSLLLGCVIKDLLRLNSFSLKKIVSTPKFLGYFVTGVVVIIKIIANALPKEHYDQLNYHLAVSKEIVNWNGFSHVFDYHLLMSGLFEYVLVWPRSLINNDYIIWSFGHAYTSVLFYGTLILALVYIVSSVSSLKYSPYQFFCAASLFPGIFPESPVFEMFKSDCYLLCASAIIVLALIFEDKKDKYTPFILLAPAMLAIKFTGIQSILSVGVLLVYAVFTYRVAVDKYKNWFLLGWALLFLVLFKNYVLLSNPFFPAAQEIFPSKYSDAMCIDYWRSVSGVKLANLYSGFAGYFKIFSETTNLAIVSTISIVLILCSSMKISIKLGLFAFIYTLSFALFWPLFYWYGIYSRFVISGFTGFFIIALFAIALIDKKYGKVGACLAITFCACFSGLDVSMSRIYRGLNIDLDTYLKNSVKTFEPSVVANRMISSEKLIVSDDPAKYLFDQKISFFDASASTFERQIKVELKRDRVSAVKDFAVGGFLVRKGSELEGIAKTLSSQVFHFEYYSLYVLTEDKI